MQYLNIGLTTESWQVYWFEKNLQGDVVAVYDDSGVKMVEYTYDAWGNHTVNYIGGILSNYAIHNPFRYRGYYFDDDLGFYYLQSRYYDSNTGRFISPDTIGFLGADGDLTSYNLYDYCGNNPVMYSDPSGHWIETFLDVISLGCSIAEVAINPLDLWGWVGLAGDLVDLMPIVTGVGEGLRAARVGSKIADNIVDSADDVVMAARKIYNGADAASDIKKATGFYEIIYSSGKNYVGKGGFGRAIQSAVEHTKNKAGDVIDSVVSIRWNKATNSRSAFVNEYLLQLKRGVNNSNTYNKIWSPGRRYFYL